jgi:hypothetical protein
LFALLTTLYARTLTPLLLLLIRPVVADAESGVPITLGRSVPPLRRILLRYASAQRGPPGGTVFHEESTIVTATVPVP